jgi:hypothetical protein
MARNQEQFQLSMRPQQSERQPTHNIPSGNSHELSTANKGEIISLTSKMMASHSNEQKNELKLSLQARMDPELWQEHVLKGQDLLYLYYRNEAVKQLLAERMESLREAELQLQEAMRKMAKRRKALKDLNNYTV